VKKHLPAVLFPLPAYLLFLHLMTVTDEGHDLKTIFKGFNSPAAGRCEGFVEEPAISGSDLFGGVWG